jgi:hypothetical protein
MFEVLRRNLTDFSGPRVQVHTRTNLLDSAEIDTVMGATSRRAPASDGFWQVTCSFDLGPRWEPQPSDPLAPL